MRDKVDTLLGSGCFIAVLIFNLIVGGWSVNYLLAFFIGEIIPFWGAAIIGLIVGEVSVPAAIVLALLHRFGVM